jgi:hypothetical protein
MENLTENLTGHLTGHLPSRFRAVASVPSTAAMLRSFVGGAMREAAEQHWP